MTSVLLLLISLSLIASGATAGDLPTQAYIHADEHGQALLLSRLQECYAVTPKHVVGGSMFATLVGASGGTPQGDADLLQTFGYDLSVLHVTGALARDCGTPLGNVPKLDDALASSSTAVVSSVNADGSISRCNVTLTDVGLIYLRVRPVLADDQLFKGLSGSLLLVGKRPAGIVMSVDPETGEGRVLRYDRALEILRPFFGLSAPDLSKKKTLAATDTIGEPTVISWSSPPLDAASRAANLTDAAGRKTAWYARADRFPIEVTLDLSGDTALAVDAVHLVGQGVTPKERLPRDFEILISTTGKDRWMPVTSGTYFMNEPDKWVRFAAVRARRVMLRIYSHWGDADAVGLTDIEIRAPQ
jgi:hypothetical protein